MSKCNLIGAQHRLTKIKAPPEMPATASRTYNLRFNHCHGFTGVLYDLESGTSLRSYQYGRKNTDSWAAVGIGGILPLDDSLHSCITVPNRPLELTIRTAAICHAMLIIRKRQ